MKNASALTTLKCGTLSPMNSQRPISDANTRGNSHLFKQKWADPARVWRRRNKFREKVRSVAGNEARKLLTDTAGGTLYLFTFCNAISFGLSQIERKTALFLPFAASHLLQLQFFTPSRQIRSGRGKFHKLDALAYLIRVWAEASPHHRIRPH